MRLIADSGSTKTAWHIGHTDFETQGINPFHQQEDVISHILHDELLPQLPAEAVVTEVSFYGAGCTQQMSPRLVDALHEALSPAVVVEVGSDMLGAARALCGKSEGIACILGTGANSCLYDGTDIVANISPLGYILGDEGSAAYIGKRLVGDVLKQQMPRQVCQLFFDETHHTAASIVETCIGDHLPTVSLASSAASAAVIATCRPYINCSSTASASSSCAMWPTTNDPTSR